MANLTRTRQTRRARRARRENIAGAALIAACLAFLGTWFYLAAEHDCRAGIIESPSLTCNLVK